MKKKAPKFLTAAQDMKQDAAMPMPMKPAKKSPKKKMGKGKA